jgi:hypothetical protein
MRQIVLLALCLATGAVVAAGAPPWRRVAEPLPQRGIATEPRFDAFHRAMVERKAPQERAADVLGFAINGYEGAAEYAIANAASWRGAIEPTPALTATIATALRAPRLEVRMAAFEVTLAGYGVEKTPAQVDVLLAKRRADPEEHRAWTLWSLALIGARGVERERVYGELVAATQDAGSDARVDAVEALALFGGSEVIAPLLAIAAGDRSARVRERAFCALAASATLHVAERHDALPGLLAIASDVHAGPQARAWSYQALREISGIDGVADDPVAWQRALADAGLPAAAIAR